MAITTENIEQFLNNKCTLSGWRNRTWREWLASVLITLNEEGEGFSGKRPNCDSGWEMELSGGLAVIDPAIVLEWEEEECKQPDGSVVTFRYAWEVNWDLQRTVFQQVIGHIFGITGEWR